MLTRTEPYSCCESCERPPSSGALNPHLGVRPCFPCTESPSAQTRARSLLSLSVTQVPITWQVGDFLSESEALDVSLLNFIFKTDYLKWPCTMAESTVPPSEVQPLLRDFTDVFPSNFHQDYLLIWLLIIGSMYFLITNPSPIGCTGCLLRKTRS